MDDGVDDGVRRPRDLSELLREWPYESGQINVRLIEGEDGEPKVQMRLDLGLLQMEASGRPDGTRPEGYESLLEYFEADLDQAVYEAAEDDESGLGLEEPDFSLSGEDCKRIREEGVQYYHRYIALLILGQFLGVVRDTTRNLRMIELCSRYAESEEDRAVLEQFRPYVTMMRTRALASQMIADDEPKAALFLLEEGLARLRGVFEEQDRGGEYEGSHEAQILRGMCDELRKKLPSSQHAELRQRLEEAIRRENYELAAILRDELKMLRE